MRALRKYATLVSRNVFEELHMRGMVARVTSQRLRDVLDRRKVTLYAGVDPSAPSLHVGNLAVLITILHFQLHGHKVIPMIGGATGRVGDPGGRTTEREPVALDKVEHNAASITAQTQRFFHMASQFVQRKYASTPEATLEPPTVLNNLAWHSNLTMLDFLRFPGKQLRVNSLLTRDSVRTRLGSSEGISFAEFSYQLLQAYDFWKLHKDHGVELQIGGSDQWGNIISGIELIRKESSARRSELQDNADVDDAVYGLTVPLLTTSTGEKFGKSAGNAIWLDSRMTSVFDFYQFFIRVNDSEVLKYLKYLTFIPIPEVETIWDEHTKSPEKRLAQQRLAYELTEMIHGVAALNAARTASSVLYSSAEIESQTSANEFLEAIGDHPRRRQVPREGTIGSLLTRVAADNKLTSSHAKARALLQAGGLYLNNKRVTQPDRKLETSDLMDNKIAIFRAGKEEYLILELI